MVLALVFALGLGGGRPAAALGTDLIGPPGSGAFGTAVAVLANGNIVVSDPLYDQGGVQNVGAVYLYDGATLALISVLTGSVAEDQVGGGGLTALSNGNYLIRSPKWDNGAVVDAGAVTWVDGSAGLAGTVSVANSLVGSTSGDLSTDSGWMLELANGNYVVHSEYWDNGAAVDAGAVTWASGTAGVAGPVSAANSLVGSSAQDRIGRLTLLPNGSYVVHSEYWDNGAAVDAGAVTWGSGTAGVAGPVSAANSLVGSSAGDKVGRWDMVQLANGNYVMYSPTWDNGAAVDAGAVTWASGTAGVAGAISPANSLVGSSSGDLVGSARALPNGNYVVSSSLWDNGSAVDAGAVTWASGTAGVAGPVSAANSLVGSSAGDKVGYSGVEVFADGKYVVHSEYWDNGAVANTGAITWVDGSTGLTGPVTTSNSLVGSSPDDGVGGSVELLPNGKYVVSSPYWNNGATVDAGAVTWGSASELVGPVTAANSLIGTSPGDKVGIMGTTVLPNGNYVVASILWRNGSAVEAGAVTWVDGSTGLTGPVTISNSLVGSSNDDRVGTVRVLPNGNYVVLSPYWNHATGAATWGSGTAGVAGAITSANSLVGSGGANHLGSGGITVLANGNYVIGSPTWDNGSAWEAGAVTWASGTAGVTGTLSIANSLLGSKAGDYVGFENGDTRVVALPNGNYVVASPKWDNGATVDAGAVTWGSGTAGVTGTLSAANSLVGSSAQDQIGDTLPTVLPNGNYVVRSPLWDNGGAVDAGAVTWVSGAASVAGPVSAANSLVGSSAGDKLGDGELTVLAGGNYAVHSHFWDNGAAVDAGAVTWASSTAGLNGTISAANSILGQASGQGGSLRVAHHKAVQHIVVRLPAENRVVVTDLAVSGLSVTADGPAAVGRAVRFSASLTGGSNVSYSWDFGDGSGGSGPNPSHAYAAPGSYTVTVTASNALGSATSSVTITAAYRLALPAIHR